MDNFFKHFPIVNYGGAQSNAAALNIISKIAFQKQVEQSFYTFHPYTIEEGDRPDTIAYFYYGDPGYDWIVYYSNNILDPYHDWYKDSESFKRFVETKYGSITKARQKIKLFRSNYIYDDSYIPASFYNSLSEQKKRFWTPAQTSGNVITRYERKKEEIRFDNNQTLSLQISGNTSFNQGEHVYQVSGGATVSSGILQYSNSSTAVITHTTGLFSNTMNLKGSDSLSNAVVSSVTNILVSIPSEIQEYFIPITYYEYEEELNEQKKSIRLLDASYVETIQEQFKALLSS
jgi:hypothetical protein